MTELDKDSKEKLEYLIRAKFYDKALPSTESTISQIFVAVFILTAFVVSCISGGAA